MYTPESYPEFFALSNKEKIHIPKGSENKQEDIFALLEESKKPVKRIYGGFSHISKLTQEGKLTILYRKANVQEQKDKKALSSTCCTWSWSENESPKEGSYVQIASIKSSYYREFSFFLRNDGTLFFHLTDVEVYGDTPFIPFSSEETRFRKVAVHNVNGWPVVAGAGFSSGITLWQWKYMKWVQIGSLSDGKIYKDVTVNERYLCALDEQGVPFCWDLKWNEDETVTLESHPLTELK